VNDPFSSSYGAGGEPYWWSERISGVSNWRPDEQLMDLAVVGSGYTGVSAAIEFAEAGQSVVVVEAETLGYGGNTRNGGLVTPTLHETPDALARVVGRDLADRMTQEAQGLVTFPGSQIERFGIDCDFRIGDHLMGAYTAAQYEGLARALPQYQRSGMPMRMVPKAEQRRFDTTFYHGGRLHERCASVHPRSITVALYATASE
jgi:glycine/D-amino acid oxidase-like deaminating enzyme